MNKKILSLILAIGGAFILSSCSARTVTGPQGEQGPKGEQGETGLQGEPGKNGENGETPYIGSNGNWWIGDRDTGISAQGPQGEDGEDGYTPEINIGENGNWFIDGVDTGKPATVNETHIVSFDVQGGTMPAGAPSVIQVMEGMAINSLPTPTRKDYKFLGWFTGFDVNAGQFTTTTPVYDDLQLFARWESLIPETYTVTRINYDGTVLEIDEEVQYGVVPTYDGVIPTKPSDMKYSYVFDGWSPEIKVTTENTTYVAQYSNTIVKHTIKFDVGEYGELSESVISIDGGDSIVAPSVDYTDVPDNFVLTGWYFDEEFENPVEFPYTSNTDLTIYGKREEITNITPYLTFYYDETRGGYVLRSYNEVYPLKTIRIPDKWDDGTNGEHAIVGMNSTFSGNQNIKTVILPETFEFIGDRAFTSSSVAYVDFSSSLETIGDSAFENCDYLRLATLPRGLLSIGDNAFANCSLTSITLPEGLQSIGRGAFSDCDDLTSITLPEGLQSIGSSAFYRCYYLTSITLPEGLQSISNNTFAACSNLISVTLPESLLNIGDDAFSSCGFTSITLPKGLQNIGSSSFSYCSDLTSIIIPTNVEFIGEDAFYDCSLLTIYCLDLSQPSTWDQNWSGEAFVYWYSPTDPGATIGNYWHYNEEGEPWKW